MLNKTTSMNPQSLPANEIDSHKIGTLASLDRYSLAFIKVRIRSCIRAMIYPSHAPKRHQVFLSA